MMLVKICGLKRVEDAELAVSLGASLVSAVRTESSPRRASVEEARAIFSAVGSRAIKVLVFRDSPIEDVVRDAEESGAEWVQLYDATEPELERVESGGFRLLRVYRIQEDAHTLPGFACEPEEDRPALLDVGGGGSGLRFDWGLLGRKAPPFTFIAGGVRPDNVEELLSHRPYGIDLSSGVERAPGVKDEEKLSRLFEAIGRAQ
ncbi:MAG: phosphoribosylanthranilate isomerase [Vicinamibacteria bacterium]